MTLKSILLTCLWSMVSIFVEFVVFPFHKNILFGAYHVSQLIVGSRLFFSILTLLLVLYIFEALVIFFVFENYGKNFFTKFCYVIGTIFVAWFLSNFAFNFFLTKIITNSDFSTIEDLKLCVHWALGIGGPSIGFPSHGSIKISLALIPVETSIAVRIILRIFKKNRRK